jgi:nucleoside-diphosphate kinase
MEKSLVIIKPDGVSKKVVGKIITCFENQDLNIEKIKMMKISRELACRHYYEHRDKDFFKQLLEYITSKRQRQAQLEVIMELILL